MPRLLPVLVEILEAGELLLMEDPRRSMSMLYALRGSSSAILPDLYLGSARSKGKISLDNNDLGRDLAADCDVLPARSVPDGPGTAPTVKPLGLPTPGLVLLVVRDEAGAVLVGKGNEDEDVGLADDLAAASMASRSLRCSELLRWRIIGTARDEDGPASTLPLALVSGEGPEDEAGAGSMAIR